MAEKRIFHRFIIAALLSAGIFTASPCPAAGTDFAPEEKFRELAADGRLSELCGERCTLNLDAATAGGKVWWKSVECNNWKLQFHKISGHWRILDPENRRRAWGVSLRQLEKFLQNHPTSFFANYFDNGECFYRYRGKSQATVVLIHGWAVRASSLEPFARFLQRENFNVLNYDYPTSEKNIREHAEIFMHKLRQEKISAPVYFLTHSMGGIILRHAIALMNESELNNIAAIVMLGPPNCGSPWAIPGEMLLKNNHSVTDLVPFSEALRLDLPEKMPPLGIIAGTRDIIVPEKYTAAPGQFQMISKEYSHAGLRNPEKTGRDVLKFFREKRF